MNKLLKIEVVYASAKRQCLLTVELESPSTIEMAIRQSGILTEFPAINLRNQNVGVFGKRCLLSDSVKDGDRIEIYRALIIDPKDARRAKAGKLKS